MSKLRGVEPTEIVKHPKIFFFGRAKVGKTTIAMSFPKPYFIDTERGGENDQYVELLRARGGKYWQTTDLAEIIKEIIVLMTEKHDYKTLVIDPVTIPYNEILDEDAATMGQDWGRYKIRGDRMFKHLLALLLRLDMNVVLISHAKGNWEKTKDEHGKEVSVLNGWTFDCFNKIDYVFDLIVEVLRRGPDRIALVRGSRVKSIPELSEFPLSYDELASRYGREVLDRDAVPIELATAEQIEALAQLLSVRTDGDDLSKKWLKKAGAEDLSELPKDIAEKCIAYLREGKKEVA